MRAKFFDWKAFQAQHLFLYERDHMDITINDKKYDLDSLTPEAKNQLTSMQTTDQKIAELQRDMAIAMTARNAYAKALTESLKAIVPKSA
jgi:recombinational DNA repair ATPase RecF